MGISPQFILDSASGVWHRPRAQHRARPCLEPTLCGEVIVAVALAFDECGAVDLLCHHCEEIIEGRPVE